MARGKHARKKAGRTAAALENAITETRLAIARERELLAIATEKAATVQTIRDELTTTQNTTQAALAPYVDALNTELDTARRVRDEAARAEKDITDRWARYTNKIMDLTGGGRVGVETITEVLIGTGYVVESSIGSTLSAQRKARLQLLRGERSAGTVDVTADDASTRKDRDNILLDLITPALRPGLRTDTPETHEQRIRILNSRPFTPHPDSIYAWWPTVWLLDRTLTEIPTLIPGAYGPLPANTPPRPGWPAATRTLETNLPENLRHDLSLTEATGRLDTPWARLPRFARPGDAVLLRGHYTASAYGAYLWARDDVNTDNLTPENPSTWRTPNPTPTAHLYAWATQAITTATPFWLPPAQTEAFATSEPINSDDLAMLRLPFRSVMVTFSEPLTMPATPNTTTHATYAASRAFQEGNKKLRTPDPHTGPEPYYPIAELIEDTVSYAYNNDQTLAETHAKDLITAYGAKVEGIILTSTETGELAPDFIWLVAINSAEPDTTAARIPIPATTTTTHPSVTAIVTNMAAATAWADWHDPAPAPTEADTAKEWRDLPDFPDEERRGTYGNVHVLNVARTNHTTPTNNTGTGRHVRSHVRRGHWRRQRYGTGRTLTRMVRIAPTVVGANNDPLTPTVYTLPTKAE